MQLTLSTSAILTRLYAQSFLRYNPARTDAPDILAPDREEALTVMVLDAAADLSLRLMPLVTSLRREGDLLHFTLHSAHVAPEAVTLPVAQQLERLVADLALYYIDSEEGRDPDVRPLKQMMAAMARTLRYVRPCRL